MEEENLEAFVASQRERYRHCRAVVQAAVVEPCHEVAEEAVG